MPCAPHPRLDGANGCWAGTRGIERAWFDLYDRDAARFGMGLGMRALSAVDVALWDLLGQSAGQPVWQLWAPSTSDWGHTRAPGRCTGGGLAP
jgi:hypothetical protein